MRMNYPKDLQVGEKTAGFRFYLHIKEVCLGRNVLFWSQTFNF
jgi:hypothetical protein